MLFPSLLLLGWLGFVSAKVQFVGVNIAGLDFGCAIDGTCVLSQVQVPLASGGGADGIGQMQHFATDDQMNIFRITVSWQFLTNNKLGGTLDATNFGKFDQLMQGCLATGAMCVIDLHNYGRFNGQIIGQSAAAVTDTQFADIWTQLATKYKISTKVIFGLMNEPHDLDIGVWATTCQAAVTAIRNAGATSQMILLPGTNFASASQWISSGSADALVKVKNPDGSVDGLIMDLHKYLDVDNSGTHSTCTTDNIANAFALAAAFLRTSGRKALVSETGAGTDATCFTDFCAQNTFLNQNSDVFLGYIAWGAGSFPTSYILSLTPTKQNGKFVDKALASQCVIAPWLSATGTVASSSAATVASTAATTAEAAVSGTSSANRATTTITMTSTSSRIVATTSITITMSFDSQNNDTSTVVGSTGLLPAPTQGGAIFVSAGEVGRGSLVGWWLVVGLLAVFLL